MFHTPLIVSRFDVAMEPAPEEDQVLTIGCIADDGHPVALLLDEETRGKVADWLAPPVAVHGTKPVEPSLHLEDGSTHTVQALTEAGEVCVQQLCRAAHGVQRLRQQEYSLRAGVDYVLDEVGRQVAEGQITAEVAETLRGMLRQALDL